MKEVTLKIPDKKLSFFMKLFKQLGLEVTQEQEVEIPEEHKEIVLERIRNSKPQDMIPWKEARKQFHFKHKT